MAAADETPSLAAENLRPETIRGAGGFFRVAQTDDDRQSLLAPDGRPFFCKAVNEVRAATAAPAADGGGARDSAARLRAWGFNALGPGGDGAVRDDGFAFLASVDFCRAGAVLVAPDLRLPDVFDPEWPRLARARAAGVCAPLAANRALIGWMSDDAIAWAQTARVHAAGPAPAGRPTLLQLCLSLEPCFAAYHAAWEFALALHGGKLESLARAWDVALANKEVVRELTRAERGIATRGYLRDEARWTREFARRYFTSTSTAIRAADPNHLVLGCRFQTVVGAHVLAECAYPAVDVAMPHWSELPPAGAAVGRATNPIFAGDVCWAEGEFIRAGLPASRAARLTSVERMLRRGRAALERVVRHPHVVGYSWAKWHDEPGEQPPFARGLVHTSGAEAREHTELLADLNQRAEKLRRAAAKTLSL